jgi:DNA gyrase subunit A
MTNEQMKYVQPENPFLTREGTQLHTAEDLGISEETLVSGRHEEIREDLTELAISVLPGNNLAVAVLTVDGQSATGVDIEDPNSQGAHALQLAVWKAYSEYRAPIAKAVVVTRASDAELCTHCMDVLERYAANPDLWVVDAEGTVIEENIEPTQYIQNHKNEEPGPIDDSQATDNNKSQNRAGNNTTETGKSGFESEATRESSTVGDGNLDVEYIHITGKTYHIKRKKLNTTFCGQNPQNHDYRASDQKPDLLEPCQMCIGEGGVTKVEEQKAELRHKISELVSGVRGETNDPDVFSIEEMESLIEAVPAEFVDFEKTAKEIRYQLSQSIAGVSDSPESPGTFDRSQMRSIFSAITEGDVIPLETHLFAYTSKGNLRTLPARSVKLQHRGGVGEAVFDPDGDASIKSMFTGSPRDRGFAFTSQGKVHRFNLNRALETDSRYISFSEILNVEPDESVEAVLTGTDIQEQEYIATVTRDGYIKRTSTAAFENIHSGGIRATRLAEGDEFRGVTWTSGSDDLLIETSGGMAIRFSEEEEVRPMGRTARGVGGIKLDDGDEVIDLQRISSDSSELSTITKNGYGKRTAISKYQRQARYGRGLIDIVTDDRNGPVVSVSTPSEDYSMMILSRTGRVIHIPVDEISVSGRNTKGVILMRLKNDESVVDTAVVRDQQLQ